MLDIGGHNLGTIDWLSDFKNLTNLWLWGNDLDNADMKALDGKDLEELNINDNNLTDITFVENFPNLTQLSAAATGISDLTPLASLTKLQEVWLEENEISDITALVENMSLGDGDTIDISENLLDLTEGSDDKINIDALIARGVEVFFDDQKTE